MCSTGMLNKRQQWSCETAACCLFTYESRFNMHHIVAAPWCLSSSLVSPRASLLSQSYSLCICITPHNNAIKLLIYSPSNHSSKLTFFCGGWKTSDNSPAAGVLLLILLKKINTLLSRLLYFPLRYIHLLFSSHAKMVRFLGERLLGFLINTHVSPTMAGFSE